MKENIPNKDEQIEALVHDKEYQLTMKYAGRDPSGRPLYAQVFNVTRKEIKKYLQEHYKIPELPFVYTSPGLRDGIYVLPVIGGYLIYNQERSIHFGEKTLETDEDVWNWYVDYRLRTSGTGLKWE